MIATFTVVIAVTNSLGDSALRKGARSERRTQSRPLQETCSPSDPRHCKRRQSWLRRTGEVATIPNTQWRQSGKSRDSLRSSSAMADWPFLTFLGVFGTYVGFLGSLETAIRRKHRRKTSVTEKYPLGLLSRVRQRSSDHRS